MFWVRTFFQTQKMLPITITVFLILSMYPEAATMFSDWTGVRCHGSGVQSLSLGFGQCCLLKTSSNVVFLSIEESPVLPGITASSIRNVFLRSTTTYTLKECQSVLLITRSGLTGEPLQTRKWNQWLPALEMSAVLTTPINQDTSFSSLKSKLWNHSFQVQCFPDFSQHSSKQQIGRHGKHLLQLFGKILQWGRSESTWPWHPQGENSPMVAGGFPAIFHIMVIFQSWKTWPYEYPVHQAGRDGMVCLGKSPCLLINILSKSPIRPWVGSHDHNDLLHPFNKYFSS